MALSSGPISRDMADALADDPEAVDDLLFKINTERKTQAILARHGIT